MHILLLSLLALALPAFSSIVLTNPPGQQLPLIARVGEPYSWALASDTFTSTAGELLYSASSTPSWLSFNSATLTFSGTPSIHDEGNPEIKVTARNGASTTSSTVTLCVTSYPAPVLNLPVADQFHAANPSLSSVFLLSTNSALNSNKPALRIPPQWSFSIGFEGKTFTTPNNLYYSVLQANGSALPPWMEFNHKTITLNGVTPNSDDFTSPQILQLALHASDQEGYSAGVELFDIVLALHELWSATNSMPTINVTASTPFSVGFNSWADFAGILIDKEPIQPGNISSFYIDVSEYKEWLTFEQATRILNGHAPANLSSSKGGPNLPVFIQTSFNQSIKTNLSLAIVPSYFRSDRLPSIQVNDDGIVDYSLGQYFSNATTTGADLTASFDPVYASHFLSFDAGQAALKGRILSEFAAAERHLNVTFTAYSHETHSTSHAGLTITLSPSVYQGSRKKPGVHPAQLSPAARKRLALGLGVTFGFIGGVCLIGAFLASVRRCARVDDTAIGGEAGRNVWSEKDKKWYGLHVGNQRPREERAREDSPVGSEKSRNGLDLEAFFNLPPVAKRDPRFGDISLHNPPPPSSSASVAGSNVMSKREFMTKIKNTVRQVSDQYQRMRQGPHNNRPVIGRPVPIPSVHQVQTFTGARAGYPNSSLVGSSLDSNAGSIPQRRADFGPRRSPASVHFIEDLPGPSSSESSQSFGSDADLAEAVVQTASRATSIKSGQHNHTEARPRLVPFTSSTRVPVPQFPPAVLQPGTNESRQNVGNSKRISSQQAIIVDDVETTPSSDELNVSIQYVRTLGETVDTEPSTPTINTNRRSSFSSLESSHHGHGGALAGGAIQRILVRTGQKFQFRVPVLMEASPSAYTRARVLKAKLISGAPLPKFVRANLNGKQQGSIEFYGTPGAADVGEVEIGVFKEDDECVARVLVEVITHQRG